MSSRIPTAIVAGLVVLCASSSSHAAETLTLASPYVFTDEQALVEVDVASVPAELAYEMRTITRQGVGPTKTGSACVTNGTVPIRPVGEGIHILNLKTNPPQTLRFLAFAPPTRLETKALRRALPQSYKKLLSGQPFKILSMGDSVTHTGDYESLLAKMLKRATGNGNILFVDRSYPGRSIDASVREWKNDGPPNKPDLGLIMYGLNEESTNVPTDTYREQYAWLAQQLKQLGADTVFLQPTPDISIPVSEEQRKPDSNSPSYIVRTLGLAHAVESLGRELKVPVAETFSLLWGSGGASLEESARSLWPMYPIGYDSQLSSLLEADGKGDTIHPNALGHLQIARAVFDALNGVQKHSSWQWKAQTRWTPRGAISTLSARNVSGTHRRGRLEVASPSDATLQAEPVTYDLAPGQSVQLSVLWTQAQKPEDLLTYPCDRYLLQQTPLVPVVDFSGASGKHTSLVQGVSAPFEAAVNIRRARQVVTGSRVIVEYTVDKKQRALPVQISANSDVGRIPIIQKVPSRNTTGWLVGEVAYVRYGAARSGEATVDGDLSEWNNAIWSPVGEVVQARSWKGPLDNRIKPEDAYLRWAFKAGKDGIYLSSRATGDLSRDSFTIFFDPRAPKLLGTVGRYYWIGGRLLEGGRLEVTQGETSTAAQGLKGQWKKTKDGLDLEIFVPYAALDATTWPQSGDLGLSIVWVHLDQNNQRTDLLWSENGHWWSPRWYGVVRRTDAPQPNLPLVVRVN